MLFVKEDTDFSRFRSSFPSKIIRFRGTENFRIVLTLFKENEPSTRKSGNTSTFKSKIVFK